MNRLISSALFSALLAASFSASALSYEQALALFLQETQQKELEDAKREEEAAKLAREEAQKAEEEQKLRDSVVARDDEATVVKNLKLIVEGNVATNDSEVKNCLLLSPPVSNFGSLEFDSSGKFTYKLNNNSKATQSLREGDFADDVFEYFIEGTDGSKSKSARLIVHILGTQSTPSDNVEIESNARSHLATPLHSGQLMKGHLQSSGDKDWFSIASSGNEILHLEICPLGTSCHGLQSWVVYVFDSDRLTLETEKRTFPLRMRRDDSQQILSTYNSNHMYLALNTGAFDDSLVGIIDPCFGKTNALDIGVGDGPRNYLVAISTPLQGDGDKEATEEGKVSCGTGSVILTKAGPSFEEVTPGEITVDDEGNEEQAEDEVKVVTTTEEYISIFPYSDDQYSLIVTGTGVNPLLSRSAKSASYDHDSRIVNIPSVRVGDRVFAAELLHEQETARSGDASSRLKLLAVNALEEQLTGDPLQTIFNQENNKVLIPQLVDDQTGKIYTVELLYHPGNGEESWLEVTKITEVK